MNRESVFAKSLIPKLYTSCECIYHVVFAMYFSLIQISDKGTKKESRKSITKSYDAILPLPIHCME